MSDAIEEGPKKLLDVAVARNRLLDKFEPLGVEMIRIEDANRRVVAQDITSPMDFPFFTNSAMDGFAVRVADLHLATSEKPVTLDVVGDVPAGVDLSLKLGFGQAVRIMTGASVPDGAEAIVPVEDTNFNYRTVGLDAPRSVEIKRPVQIGENIRFKGEDISTGTMVIRAGDRIRPQGIGLLAMLGIPEISVHHKPRVAILSAGDELLPLDEPLTPGKIHDSNSFTLIALVREAGGVPVDLGIVDDNREMIRERMDKAISSEVDLILTSAGVSVGTFDFVRSVVEQHGQLDFWRVNMRPGKPLAFGRYGDIPFVGLPGNPVSAYVGFEVFVRAILRKLGGMITWYRITQRVTLSESIESDGREAYLRAVVCKDADQMIAYLTGHQGSGNLHSLVQANALIIIPSEVKYLPENSLVDAWFIGDIPECGVCE